MIGPQRRVHCVSVEHLHGISLCDAGGFGPLFEIGIALSQFVRNPDFRRAIHIPATDFVACEADSVSEPFTCDKDRHFDAESELCVDDGEITAECFQKFHEAGAPDCDNGRWIHSHV